MTEREKLIEAMARGMHDARPPRNVEGKLLDFYDPANCTSMNCRHDATAALAAIEASGSVVVPVEATERMERAGGLALHRCSGAFGSAGACYAAMIAAGPYAKEPT
jgi:hypothetical protein